jgi:hypothetical protein
VCGLATRANQILCASFACFLDHCPIFAAPQEVCFKAGLGDWQRGLLFLELSGLLFRQWGSRNTHVLRRIYKPHMAANRKRKHKTSKVMRFSVLTQPSCTTDAIAILVSVSFISFTSKLARAHARSRKKCGFIIRQNISTLFAQRWIYQHII